MSKPLNFIFIGRSGSGKGTQAKLLLEKFPNTTYIYTGDLMRELIKRGTDVGFKLELMFKKGELPSERLATTLWMAKIAYDVKTDQGIMLDGSPRRVEEAKHIEEFFVWLERWDNTKIFYVDISKEEALKRLLNRGRNDDKKDNILERLAWFDECVIPAVNHFDQIGKLIRINGEQSVEKVAEEILTNIK